MSNVSKFSVSDLVELAKEVESGDPIDWGMLEVDEEVVYNTIALSVMEKVDEVMKRDGRDSALIITMASLTKVLVENFANSLERLKKV